MKARNINARYTIQHCLKHGASEKWLSSGSHSHMNKQFAYGAWSVIVSNYGGILKYRMVDADTGVVVDAWDSPEARVGLHNSQERANLLKIVQGRGEFIQSEDGYIYFAPKGGHLLAPHQLHWIADEVDKKNREWNCKINEL